MYRKQVAAQGLAVPADSDEVLRLVLLHELRGSCFSTHQKNTPQTSTVQEKTDTRVTQSIESPYETTPARMT